jgi:hypothetical protein
MLGLGYSYLGQEFVDQMLGVRDVANALEMMIENALRRGIAEGEEQGQVKARQEDITGVLVARFGEGPQPVQDQITRITDLARLRNLLYAAATASSLAAFTQLLREAPGA